MGTEITLYPCWYKWNLVKRHLPYGYAKEVATQLDVPAAVVYRVANGAQPEPEVFLALVKVAKRYRETVRQINVELEGLE